MHRVQRPNTARLPQRGAMTLLLVTLAGCGHFDEGVAALRSTDAVFVASRDPRVFVEPGAPQAAAVIASVEQAVRRVEGGQGGPFHMPIRIYVCATLATYKKFTGHDLSGGDTTVRHKIFISPKPQNTAARIPFVVAHELSHLHLGQDWSWLQASRVPIWFNEGLAALISDGGGAEDVTEGEAAAAIRAGRTFTPVGSRGFSGAHFGLTPHLFYRQAAMFIAYLRAADPDGFLRFLSEFEHGRPFPDAFARWDSRGLERAWRDFVAQLPAPSSGP